MKYRFDIGEGKKVIISGDETFESLGYEILREYGIKPDQLDRFMFADGDITNSISQLEQKGIGIVSIKTKIKDRKLEIGEDMILAYKSPGWAKKATLEGIEE